MSVKSKVRVLLLDGAGNPQLVVPMITESVDMRLGVWLTAAAATLAYFKANAKRRPLVMSAAFAASAWAASAQAGRETTIALEELSAARRAYEALMDVTDVPYDMATRDFDALMAAQNVAEMAIASHALMYNPSRRKSLQQLVAEARQADSEYVSPMDLAYRSVDHLIDAGVSKRAIVDTMLRALDQYPHSI